MTDETTTITEEEKLLPAPEQQPMLMPPKKSFSWLPVFVALTLLFAALAAYFFIRSYTATSISGPLNYSPNPSPTTAASADPTADWETYTNTSANYSIKYPSTLRLIDSGARLATEKTATATSKNVNFVYQPDPNIGAKELVIIKYSSILPGDKNKLSEKREIGKETADCWSSDDKVTSYCWVKSPVSDFYLYFIITNYADLTVRNMYDKILSTFKFTTQNKLNTDTGTWKTYGSRTDSFTVKLPPEVNGLRDTDYGYTVASYTGSVQRPDTELGDGFTLNFRLIRRSDNETESLSEFVDKQIVASKENADISQKKETIQVSSYQGFTYSAVGLGESKYIYLSWPEPSPSNKSIMEIIVTVADPNKQGYQNLVDLILSTLKYSAN